MRTPQITIVGRGAVGAVYCDAFARCPDVELRVAVDQSRLERYRNEDFIFNGQKLDLEYFTPRQEDPPADLIIIATKWNGYGKALEMIEPIVGEKTLILPLLNGLLPYEVAEKRYGEHRVMRGYYIGHTASRNDTVAAQDGAYCTVVGEKINREGNYSNRLQEVIEIFERSSIKYRVDEDMESSRWLKFIINLGLNQTSALDGGLNYGQILSSKHYTELCAQLMEEGGIVARQLGINQADSMTEEARKLLDTIRAADFSSMAQDILAGRTTEWEIFGGYLLNLASKLDVELPAHKAIEKFMNQTMIKR